MILPTSGRAKDKTHGSTIRSGILHISRVLLASLFIMAAMFDLASTRAEDRGQSLEFRYGLVDAQGRDVLPPIYRSVISFREETGGLAFVTMDDGLMGMVNQSNKFVVEPNCTALHYFDKKSGLALVRCTSLWGLVDRSGRFVIEPRYDYLNQFDEETGLAKARLNGKSGYVDRMGKFEIDPTHDSSGRKLGYSWTVVDQTGTFVFEPIDNDSRPLNMESVRATIKLVSKYGFVDRSCNPVTEVKRYRAPPYFLVRQSSSRGQLDKKWGFVDGNGEVVVEPIYDEVKYFDTEICKVKLNGKWGLTGATGRIMIEPKYEEVYKFNKQSGLLGVKLDGKWGLIDRAGVLVIQPAFEAVKVTSFGTFSPGLVLVKLNGKWGLIDGTDRVVVEPQYDEIYGLDKPGLLRVKLNGKWGFIDVTGKVVVEAQYDEVRGVDKESGLLPVKLNGKWGWVDSSTGKLKIEPTFEAISSFGMAFPSLAMVKLDDKWGWVDRTGKFVIEPTYEKVKYFNKGTGELFVMLKSKWGMINRSGEMVIEPLYEDVQPLSGSKGLAIFKLNSKWGFIDQLGNVVAAPKYDYVERERGPYGHYRVGVRR